MNEAQCKEAIDRTYAIQKRLALLIECAHQAKLNLWATQLAGISNDVMLLRMDFDQGKAVVNERV